MDLKILGSSSKENCYILENDHEALIIEAGVKFDAIKQALNFNIRKVVGCLVTHEHLDHSVSMQEVLNAGIQLYTSAGTAKARDIAHHRLQLVKSKEVVNAGGFQIMFFDTKHDAAEPLGFVIKHAETGNVVFLTDTYYSGYKFKNIHNIIVEANYGEAILKSKYDEGTLQAFRRDRIFKSHMSVETCLELLKANDLSKVNNIVLIHLSDSNSNADQFKEMVRGTTGKTVHIADAGLLIKNFNKQPF